MGLSNNKLSNNKLTIKHKKAVLILADGSTFEGTAIGAVDQTQYTCGEVVFNTSLTGYQEIISDPSYCEQIVLFTQPHIGNVGVNSQDTETTNQIWAKGIIIKSLSQITSNWRSEDDLNNYLKKNNLIGIADLDTRAIATILRDKGSQKGCIYILPSEFSELASVQKFDNNILEKINNILDETPNLENLDLAQLVTCKNIYEYKASPNKSNSLNNLSTQKETKPKLNKHIIVYDYGVKRNILNLLAQRFEKITVVPAKTDISKVLELKPDGILLSNGPGDPAACDYAIEDIKKLINLNQTKKQYIPILGICLGCQLLGLALGAKTKKMKFGHHGANHPVKDLNTNKVTITSQNHGFMIDESSLDNSLTITHRSLFDNSIQGISHTQLPILGFQGHPEASPGPYDITYIFDQFLNLCQKEPT